MGCVAVSGIMTDDIDLKVRDSVRGANIMDYWPLLVLLSVSLFVAFFLADQGEEGLLAGMHYYMGFLLCSSAMLKLFNPEAFAKGFAMYDLLAKKVKAYGYVYPLLELVLGLAYFSFAVPWLVYVATIILFVFGAAGVVQALRENLDIYSSRLGSILKVPLSTVSLVEDIGVAVLAVLMFVMRSFSFLV